MNIKQAPSGAPLREMKEAPRQEAEEFAEVWSWEFQGKVYSLVKEMCIK